jgi:hypothetical protein
MKVYNFYAIEENHIIISDTIQDAINIFVGHRFQSGPSKRYRFVPGVIEYLGDNKAIRVKDLPGGTLCIQNVWDDDNEKEVFYERYDVRESEFQMNKIY